MKKKILAAIGILVLISAFIGFNVYKTKGSPTFGMNKGIEVNVAKIKSEKVISSVSVNGVVDKMNSEDIFVDSPVRVKNVLVSKDEVVKKGQRLFEFDTEDLQSQLKQTQITLNIQKIGLQKLKDSLELQNTDQLDAALEQSKNSFIQAEDNYKRVETLYNQGAVSKNEFENTKLQYNNSKLQYELAQSNLNNAKKTILNNQKDVETQENQIKLTELQVDNMQAKLSKLNLLSISPENGIVTELNIESGNMANPAMSLAEISNTDEVEVKLDVKEVDVMKIKVDQNVEITGDAFGDKIFYGKVKIVGATAKKKQTAGNSDEAFVEVTVSINNSDKILKPGLSVNAKVITEVKENVPVIPFDAFHEDKDGNKWAFVVENNIAKQRTIKLGISSELRLEVTEGLKTGEMIIIDPPARLKDGMNVIIKNQNSI